MVNRYTADKRVRSDDAYTPEGVGGRRPDRSVIVYAQRVREAFPDAPIVIGGIEASLRRIAHYDYWQEKVRRSILLDARADLLVFGNGERQIVEIAHRLAAGEQPSAMRDIRGTALLGSAADDGWTEIDSTHLDTPGPVEPASGPVRDGARDCGRSEARRGTGRARRALHAPRADGRSRAQLHPFAELRAGRRRPGALRARVADPAHGVEPRQRARARAAPRRQRRVAQSAAAAAVDAARWTASTSCRTRACRTRRTAKRRSRPTR